MWKVICVQPYSNLELPKARPYSSELIHVNGPYTLMDSSELSVRKSLQQNIMLTRAKT